MAVSFRPFLDLTCRKVSPIRPSPYPSTRERLVDRVRRSGCRGHLPGDCHRTSRCLVRIAGALGSVREAGKDGLES